MKSNEVAAILEDDEEVLTADDPRHIRNGGASGPSSKAVKIINAFDAVDMLEQAMASGRGEEVLLNFVSANKDAFKGALS